MQTRSLHKQPLRNKQPRYRIKGRVQSVVMKPPGVGETVELGARSAAARGVRAALAHAPFSLNYLSLGRVDGGEAAQPDIDVTGRGATPAGTHTHRHAHTHDPTTHGTHTPHDKPTTNSTPCTDRYRDGRSDGGHTGGGSFVRGAVGGGVVRVQRMNE